MTARTRGVGVGEEDNRFPFSRARRCFRKNGTKNKTMSVCRLKQPSSSHLHLHKISKSLDSEAWFLINKCFQSVSLQVLGKKFTLAWARFDPRAASYPDVSLSMKMHCRLYPSHCPLRFITSHSRFALASTMRKTKRLRRRLIPEHRDCSVLPIWLFPGSKSGF